MDHFLNNIFLYLGHLFLAFTCGMIFFDALQRYKEPKMTVMIIIGILGFFFILIHLSGRPAV